MKFSTERDSAIIDCALGMLSSNLFNILAAVEKLKEVPVYVGEKDDPEFWAIPVEFLRLGVK